MAGLLENIGRDLKLDASGDWAVEGGDMALVSGAEAIAQALRIRLQFFKGEWFLAVSAGVPYFQSVLGKGVDANALRGVFRTAILETPGVLELLSLELDFDAPARRLAVSYRVSCDFGEITQTVEI